MSEDIKRIFRTQNLDVLQAEQGGAGRSRAGRVGAQRGRAGWGLPGKADGLRRVPISIFGLIFELENRFEDRISEDRKKPGKSLWEVARTKMGGASFVRPRKSKIGSSSIFRVQRSKNGGVLRRTSHLRRKPSIFEETLPSSKNPSPPLRSDLRSDLGSRKSKIRRGYSFSESGD